LIDIKNKGQLLTTGHKTCRFHWIIERFAPHQVLYRGIQTHLRNPARFIPCSANVLPSLNVFLQVRTCYHIFESILGSLDANI
jgi:hypothetical protein